MVQMLYNIIKVLTEEINPIFNSIYINGGFKNYCLLIKPDRIYNDFYILDLSNIGLTFSNDSAHTYFFHKNIKTPIGKLYLKKENYNKYNTDIGWCILNKKYLKLLNLKVLKDYNDVLNNEILIKSGDLITPNTNNIT